MTPDLILPQMLATRLCHDLAGPIGAISAGAELMGEDTDPSFAGEAVALLRHSAEAASVRLRFLRSAFGMAGRPSGGLTAQALAETYTDAVAGAAVTVEWSFHPTPPLEEDGETLQVVLLLFLTVLESLGGSGTIRVYEGNPEGGAGVRPVVSLAAQSPSARLDKGVRAVLRGEPHDLSPRSAHAALLYRVMGQATSLKMEESPGTLRLHARLPYPDSPAN